MRQYIQKHLQDRPILNPLMAFIMKKRDRLLFLKKTTPMEDSPRFIDAQRFHGEWLNNTCWSWHIFYEPVELRQALRLYAVPDSRPKKKPAHKKGKPVCPSKRKR